jgi:NADH:ubiquinone oxidoreductase subunit 6 (subunit J)
MKYFKLLLPFSALAAAFILLGIIMNDVHQVYFGAVWLLIAFISFFIKKFKHNT